MALRSIIPNLLLYKKIGQQVQKKNIQNEM